MTEIQQTTHADVPFVIKLFNGLLLLITFVLTIVTVVAMQEILVAIMAPLIVPSADMTIRQSYALVTVRNVGTVLGGLFLLGFFVYLMEVPAGQLDRRMTSRKLLRICAIEMIIIFIAIVI